MKKGRERKSGTVRSLKKVNKVLTAKSSAGWRLVSSHCNFKLILNKRKEKRKREMG